MLSECLIDELVKVVLAIVLEVGLILSLRAAESREAIVELVLITLLVYSEPYLISNRSKAIVV